MPPAPPTPDRLLDAAERLFAEQGFDGTSLRAVTQAAGANLAAAHYHFGSKAGLFQAVVERRVGAINAERLATLDAIEARGDGRPPALDEIVEALVGPALRRARGAEDDAGWTRFLRLVARMHAESGAHVEPLRRVFREVVARFLPALRRAAPHLDEETLHLRLQFLVGSMLHVMGDPRCAEHARPPGAAAPQRAPDELVAELVAFAAAGLRAPVASSVPGRSGPARSGPARSGEARSGEAAR